MVVRDANGCTITSQFTITEPTPVVITAAPTVDVNCNGANNGSVSITANGGTGALEYSIDNGSTFQSSNAFANLAPATYDVVVQDANGCTTTSQVIIFEPPMIAALANISNSTCGNSDGTISIVSNGGSGALQHSIDNGLTFQSATVFANLNAGNYNVVVQDANGCTLSFITFVNNDAAPIINNIAVADIDCNGFDNGSIAIAASGGVGVLQYSIDNGATFQASSSFTSLTPAAYNVVVVDSNGCTATSVVVVAEPSAIVVNIVPSSSSCSLANGSLVVNANGGTGVLQYSFNNGSFYQASNSLPNVMAGLYQVQVMDANGCTVALASNIPDEPSPVIVNVNVLNLTCNSSDDGSINIIANGGTGIINYSIDNGLTYASNGLFTNLPIGIYNVQISDANGCTAVTNVALIQPPAIVAITVTLNANCNQNDGTISVNANGGTAPLQYSLDGVLFQAGSVFSNLASGNYSVTVKDANGCTVTSVAVVNSNLAPVINNVVAVDITCNGLTDGSITVAASGGNGALSYSINNGSVYQPASAFVALPAGNYDVVVKDANGCTVSSQVIIVEPAPINAAVVALGTTCTQNNGTLQIVANGGTGTLQYSFDNGVTYQLIDSIIGIASGNYQLVVKDANGCENFLIAVLQDEPSPVISSVPVTDITCNGADDGHLSVLVTGGTGVLQFSNDGGTTTQLSNQFSSLSPGNYAVWVTDANGCTAISNVAIIQPSALNLNSNSTNANCNQNDGSVIVNANGGSGALQYSIDNGVSFQSLGTFGFLAAGNYSVIVRDVNGCTATTNLAVASNSAPLINNLSVVDIACYGVGNGAIQVAASGGTGTLNYSIDNGLNYQLPSSFTTLSAGIYAVVVQDASGCTVTQNVQVVEPPLLTMQASSTASTCGLNNGGVQLVAIGGTAPLLYSIDNGSTYQLSSSFSSLASGNYILSVSDNNGCTFDDNITVPDQPSPVISSINVTDLNCNSAASGIIAIAVSGGTGVISYSLDNGITQQTSPVFNGLPAGAYTILISDQNNCTATQPVVVAEPSAINVSTAIVDAVCNAANGSVTVNGNGGAGSLQFSIDNGLNFQSSNIFNNLFAGNYTVLVSDANGCANTAAGNIANAATPYISSLSVVNPDCNGSLNGTINILIAGASGTLDYSINNGITSQPTGNFVNLPAGVYHVLVTQSNGCSTDSVVTLSEPLAIAMNVVTVNATCGNADGTITVNANGGAGLLMYSMDAGVNYSPAAAFSSLNAGNYTMVVQDANGCTVSAVASISNTNAPVISGVTSSDITCAGASNGIINISVSGGAGNNQFSIDNGVTYVAFSLFSGLVSGTYNLSVMDALGCIATSSAQILEPLPVLFNSVVNDEFCSKANGEITINALGGTGALQYSIDNGITFQPVAIFANVAAGAFTAVVMDVNGCSVTSNVVVANVPGPVISSVVPADPLCYNMSNGSIIINGAGGSGALEYSIDNGVNFQSGNVFNGLSSGNYAIVVSDIKGCSVASTALINNSAVLVMSYTSIASKCTQANGGISIFTNGGTGSVAYSINNGLTYTTSSVYSNLLPATYFVVVQDANGCSVNGNVPVTDLPGPVIANHTLTDISCFNASNGNVVVNALGGSGNLQYSIDNALTFQSSSSFNNLSPGNYYVMVADSNGCMDTIQFLLQQPAPINFTIATLPSTCGNANGYIFINNVTGGTGGYQFSTDSGITYQTADSFALLNAAIYHIQVVDSNGCTSTGTVNINNLAGPVLDSINVADALCFGANSGELFVTIHGGNGPFIYSVDSGATSQSGNVFTGLSAGNYPVLITDVNGCLITTSAIINQPQVLSFAIASAIATCGGSNGSIVLNASGGSGGYVYSIDSGATTQPGSSFNQVSSGNYQLWVADANGCSSQQPLTIVNAPSPVLSIASVTDAACFGQSSGSALVSSVGGTSPLNYSIDGGVTLQASAQFNTLSQGNYSAIVVDANGCTDSVAFQVNEPSQLVAVTSAIPVACFGLANGSAWITTGGGSAPYQFSWNHTTVSSDSVSNLLAGNYSVVVTDGHGCMLLDSVVVTQPLAIAVQVQSQDVSCFGGNNGSAIVVVNGGVMPYTYVWSHAGAGTQTAFGLTPSTYNVLITDFNGCTFNQPLTIAEPPQIVITPVADHVKCFGGNDGSIAVSPSGGTGTFTYQWSVAQTGSTATGLIAGNYTVTATDANGCTTVANSVISQPALLVIADTITHILCHGLANGSINVQVTGGAHPYIYTWSSGLPSTATVNNLPQGIYTVTVTDQHNCIKTKQATIQQPTVINLNVSPDPTICIGQQASLTATATGGTSPYTFKWNTGYVGSTLTVSPAATSPYDVYITDHNGCNTPRKYANVNVFPALSAVMSDDDTLCKGESTLLNANVSGGNGGPYSLVWTNVTSTNPSVTVTPDSTTTYLIAVTDGCTVQPAFAQATVIVNHLPELIFAPLTLNGCMPLLVNFSNQTINGATYSWQFGDGENDTTAVPVHMFNAPGVYDVTLTAYSVEGCTSTLVLNDAVEVYALPEAIFEINRTETNILDPRFEFADLCINTAQWNWDFGDGRGVSNQINPFYAYADTGVYRITLIATSNENCMDTTYGEVHVGGAYTLYIPNAFTPNNDGRNDKFYCSGTGYTELKMVIYDRWGNLIFQQTSANPAWDGFNMLNSTECQQGTYVYKVSAKNIFEDDVYYKGTVTLVR